MMWATLEPLTDEERKLIEDNWNMNMFFLNLLKKRYSYDEDTLYDWVTEAAIRTAKAYDPEKGSWTALYNWKLKGVISKFCWGDTHRLKGDSLDETVLDDGRQKRQRYEYAGRPCQELEDALSKISIEQTMDSLKVTKNQQKYLIDKVFTDNPNQTELAEKYGVSRAAVTDALIRIRKRFKKVADSRGGAVDWI